MTILMLCNFSACREATCRIVGDVSQVYALLRSNMKPMKCDMNSEHALLQTVRIYKAYGYSATENKEPKP